jgi:hypothetical protein
LVVGHLAGRWWWEWIGVDWSGVGGRGEELVELLGEGGRARGNTTQEMKPCTVDEQFRVNRWREGQKTTPKQRAKEETEEERGWGGVGLTCTLTLKVEGEEDYGGEKGRGLGLSALGPNSIKFRTPTPGSFIQIAI